MGVTEAASLVVSQMVLFSAARTTRLATVDNYELRLAQLLVKISKD